MASYITYVVQRKNFCVEKGPSGNLLMRTLQICDCVDTIGRRGSFPVERICYVRFHGHFNLNHIIPGQIELNEFAILASRSRWIHTPHDKGCFFWRYDKEVIDWQTLYDLLLIHMKVCITIFDFIHKSYICQARRKLFWRVEGSKLRYEGLDDGIINEIDEHIVMAQ